MIRTFQPAEDLARLEAFLRDRFQEQQLAVSWLPERLHDLIYRVGAQEADEGRAISSDYIYLWEENGALLAGMNPYQERKKSSLYSDSFECIVVDQHTAEKNNVCGDCFVYVDRQTKTALIEPLSVREAYRRMGLGTALLQGVILRCRQQRIEKCYVDSFGWRKDFYAAAGFSIEGSIGFWYKTMDL